MQTTTIQILSGPEAGYRFQILDQQGRMILLGEVQPSKFAVLQGIAHLMAHASNEAMYARRMSPEFRYQFAVKQRSGRLIAQSPVWSRRKDREEAIQTLRLGAGSAHLIDLCA